MPKGPKGEKRPNERTHGKGVKRANGKDLKWNWPENVEIKLKQKSGK